MPQYSTPDKIADLYPKIISTKNITDKQINFYIDQAENVMNSHIAKRYTLPFSSTPPLLETISTELGFINILDRWYTQETSSENDWRTVRKRDIMKILKGLGEGTLSLVNSAGEIIGERTDIGGISSDTSGYEATFNHLDPIDQRVDPDRLQDEFDELDP